MEEEIKPKILIILESLKKNYSKLQKYQIEKLECLLTAKELSASKNKNFKKIQLILVDNFKNTITCMLLKIGSISLKENKNCIFEGVLLRLALDNKISRDEFLNITLVMK